MKRTVVIRGWVHESGMVSFGLWEDENLRDHTDIGVLSDGFPENGVAAQVRVSVEIDTDEIFKNIILDGKLSVEAFDE